MNDKQENIQKEASLFDIWRIILNNPYFIVIFSLVFLSIVVFYTVLTALNINQKQM